MNTHAAAKRTPPRCMHHLPLVTAHTVRSQKFTPALIRPPYQLRSILTQSNIQGHLCTGREGAAVPAGGHGEREGGGGIRSAVAPRTDVRLPRGAHTFAKNNLGLSRRLPI